MKSTCTRDKKDKGLGLSGACLASMRILKGKTEWNTEKKEEKGKQNQSFKKNRS
jgi:hypothetical protein